MTVSISNMAQVWMSNTNTYNAIAMSVSTMGHGANANSRLLRFKVDGNTKFDIDANGNILTSNTISSNVVYANTVMSNTVITTNLNFITVTVANLPPASIGIGTKAFVTDANQNSFLANVFSGGSNVVPVFSDGTGWKIG